MTIMSVAKKIVPTVTGIITLLLSPPIPGYSTVAQNLQENRLDKAFQSGVAGVTGIQIGGISGQKETHISIGNVLNPIEMRWAPVTKVVLWSYGILEAADAIHGAIRGYISDILKG